ncbi:MAG: cache domain-containing protein [Burkholderiaceae bacterium]|nr:cache domain-containing protein [Burkholderiaceae bacterium]
MNETAMRPRKVWGRMLALLRFLLLLVAMIQLFNKNISLRWSLTGLSLVAMLPIALFSAYTIVQVHQQHRQRILNDFQIRSEIVAKKVEARVQLAVNLLEGLAASSAAQKNQWETLYETAQRVIEQHPEFRAITLVDATGQVLFLTSLPYGSKTIPSSYTGLVQEALKTGKPNASGPFVTKISPQKLLAVTVPIRHGEDRKFVLRMILWSSTISDILVQEGSDPDWLARVIDREGTVLARSHEADTYVGRRASPTFMAAVERQERGLFHSVSFEGIPVTNTLHPIHGGDWTLYMGVPHHTLDAPLRNRLLQLVGVAMGCLLLALGLSAWLAGRITQEIRRGRARTGPSPQTGPD